MRTAFWARKEGGRTHGAIPDKRRWALAVVRFLGISHILLTRISHRVLLILVPPAWGIYG